MLSYEIRGLPIGDVTSSIDFADVPCRIQDLKQFLSEFCPNMKLESPQLILYHSVG